jgi:trans-2,3-dihydro-3-hydroxyanthranilate isomerase
VSDNTESHLARSRPSDLRLTFVIADVFTERPLAGNQLAIVPGADAVPEELYQPLAREFNFSETVFLLPSRRGGDARLRIFTPAVEIPFAGHPTLGAAFFLAENSGATRLVLETDAGAVPVEVERRADRVAFAWMEQPRPRWRPYERSDALLRALGVQRSSLPVEHYDLGPEHVFVIVESEDEVAALAPDLAAIEELRPILANCAAGSEARWKTRVFAPGSGVPEDAATGSAAGPLAVHLARHGLIAFGDVIEIRQGAEIGRPSVLYARVEGSSEEVERVLVGGSAVIIGVGELRLHSPSAAVLPRNSANSVE